VETPPSKEGIIVDRSDGIRRRLFPRILMYSSMYNSQKVIPELGTKSDSSNYDVQQRRDGDPRREMVKAMDSYL
jgi:hypothetical protein